MTISITELWNSPDPNVWDDALARYWDFVKPGNRQLEEELDHLDLARVLGGERLQYRGLDVEQIGSVYEGLMGFEVEVAEGPSLCLTPEHVVVNLEALLRLPGAERVKTLKENASVDLKDKAREEAKGAKTVEAHLVATAGAHPGRLALLTAGGRASEIW